MDKKVLIFIEDGSFTYDNRVIRESHALVASGWDVTVISPKYPDDPFYKKVNNNLRAYYYPKPNVKSYLAHFVEHGISLFFGSLLTIWVAIAHGFSIFHACNPMDILWLLALPYKIIGKKIIFDQHDLTPEAYLARGDGDAESIYCKLLMFLEKASYRFSDIVISTNESYRKAAVTRGGMNRKDVFVVRNGPDLTKFRKVTPENGLKKQWEVLVGYLGNMNIQDGVDYLLEAANEIVKGREKSEIKFVLIGGGSHQPRLVEQSKEMGLLNHVSFTGRIPDDEMLATICACDICVQPDPLNILNDVSTMNKVMEYMALEKPVIAFDLKETRVSCGDAAIYVTPNNIIELAEKIVYLADNPELRLKMGKIGKERVEKKLSWEYSIPNLMEAYLHALSK